MEYGFWLLVSHGAGHTDAFRGPFDVVMAFFYLPNLAVAEAFIRARRAPAHSAFRMAASAVLNLATALAALGAYDFGRYDWGPAILHALAGRPG